MNQSEPELAAGPDRSRVVAATVTTTTTTTTSVLAVAACGFGSDTVMGGAAGKRPGRVLS